LSVAGRAVGVLGIGPQATIVFERLVLEEAQKVLPPWANTGYPTLLTFHLRRPPVVIGPDGKAARPLQPSPELLDAAAWLGERADFLVIPANSPHVFRADVEGASGRDLLSMVDLTVSEVAHRGWSSVGLLGFGNPAVSFYADPLRDRGVRCETIDAPHQAALDQAILHVMEGRDDETSHRAALAAVRFLEERGPDGVILGCTEIPLALGPETCAPGRLDPLPLLAAETVRRAAGNPAG